ncbi:MAG: hypothetical protein NTZ13_03750 [Candidatus Parcubacteria bacterium]|nr:hypothetical protein [Candidatus Parcubacteria bacterium]
MSTATSRGQALQINARVGTQVDWDELNGDELQSEVIDLPPKEFGRRFTNFLKNGAKYPSVKRPDIFTVTSNGVAWNQLSVFLKGRGHRVGHDAVSMMIFPKSKITSGVTYLLGIIYGDDLCGKNRIMDDIYAEASCRGWLTAPMEVASLVKEKFTKKQFDDLGIRNLVIMHIPVIHERGAAYAFHIVNLGENIYFDVHNIARKANASEKGFGYCFLVPQIV